MKKSFAAFICVVSTLGLAQISFADEDGGRPSEGEVFSAGATILAETTSAVLAEIPDEKAFLMTQFCQSAFFSGPMVVGSSFGPVAVKQNEQCTEYSPGVLLDGGQTLSCEAPGLAFEDTHCLVTGFIR